MNSRDSWFRLLSRGKIPTNSPRFAAQSGEDRAALRDEKSLRYAVIGAGSVARTHLRDITSRSDVILVGIADPAPDRHWRISEAYKSVPQFTDATPILLRLSPDFVSISTPP